MNNLDIRTYKPIDHIPTQVIRDVSILEVELDKYHLAFFPKSKYTAPVINRAYLRTRDRERIEDEDTIIVAYIGTQLVGCVTCGMMDSSIIGYPWYIESPDVVVHVHQFMVVSSMRGTGIGRQLIDAVCTFAKTHNKQIIRLSVASNNVNAELAYYKMGFVTTGFSLDVGKYKKSLPAIDVKTVENIPTDVIRYQVSKDMDVFSKYIAAAPSKKQMEQLLIRYTETGLRDGRVVIYTSPKYPGLYAHTIIEKFDDGEKGARYQMFGNAESRTICEMIRDIGIYLMNSKMNYVHHYAYDPVIIRTLRNTTERSYDWCALSKRV